MRLRHILAAGLLLWATASCRGAEAPKPEAVKAAMAKATAFFRTEIACHGGYLWWYSEDLKEREGEGKATPAQVWVQKPGTPAVGEAYLRAYEVTGDRAYLDAAVEVGRGLAWGQLASGGWDYLIDFDPEGSRRWHYRRDVEAGDRETGKRRNTSTLDDDNTQLALRFLMHLDRVLAFKDAEIHKAVEYGLKAVLAAQYPCGAWPQRFAEPADPKTPVLKARYPETWSRTFPSKDYKAFYTLNDNTLRDCIETMFVAHDVYGDERYRAAALKGGEFLILAQMPEPQPAWAQQYNHDMEPAWARKFEPPSITGGESAGAMGILVDLWLKTGDPRFIQPLPAAIRWYKASRLPDGKWARFYELHTNKPLYCVKDTYEITYSDANMPTHYSFQGNYGSAVERYEALIARKREEILAERGKQPAPNEWAERAARGEPDVTGAVQALDDRGRWVAGGKIQVGTFVGSLRRMADYLEARQKSTGQ